MRRKQDLHLAADDLRELDLDAGLTPVISPADAPLDADVEDDDAFAALRDDLSPGEATRTLEDMRPLSDEEAEIFAQNPGLGPLRRVDDSEHEAWMNELSRDGYAAMDKVLDDAIYGDGENMDREEKLERSGSDDAGFGLPSFVKKAAGFAAKTVDPRTHLRMAKNVGRRAAGLVKRFVPSRDRGKAKMVADLNRKLVVEHANWLGVRDQQAGRQVQPRAAYVAQSRTWARAQIARAGLPTTTTVRGADVLGADLLGPDVMGSWWNPLSWFSEKVNVVVNQTAGQRSPVGPDGQPLDPSLQDPSMQDPSLQDPSLQDPSLQDPYAAEQYAADPYAAQAAYPQEAYPDYAYGDARTGIAGDDTLGAFVEEVLTGVTPEPKKTTGLDDDKVVRLAAARLARGKSLSPGDVAVIASMAKRGHGPAKKLYELLLSQGAPASSSGAWLHRLNPAYWLKSSDERKFKDAEVERWKENAELQKRLAKRTQVLDQAERAKQAAAAVEAARAQSAATEAQLKAIEAQLAATSASGMGHEKPTPVSDVVRAALERAGKLKVATSLRAKIASGQPLDKKELGQAREIVAELSKIKVTHGDLMRPELAMMHGAFVGACLRGAVRAARRKNAVCGRAATSLSKKLASGQPLATKERAVGKAIVAQTARLQDFTRKFASGAAFRGIEDPSRLHRSCVLGAAKAAMTPAEKKMLSAIAKLAKAGNPRAVESIRRLRASGAIMGGDHVGISFSVKDAFKYATAPIWLPAQHIAKAAKWTGQKLGIVSKGGGSPQDVRLAQLRAAAKRRQAAAARARAADAQTEAELRAQQSIADAADAEAEAADAEALSKEAAMRTKEIEADPSLAATDDDAMGWSSFVGEEDRAIVAKAAEKSPTGDKIRAGAALYARALRGSKQATQAIATMVGKAKKGDAQAKRDVVAVRAGKKALAAKKKAEKKQARALARKARAARVRAVQKRAEAAIANKLARTERRVELARLSRVERRAAAGNKPARAYVQKQVDLAKRGDRRAASRVKKMQLAKQVRQAAPTKRERRNLAAAGRLYARARRGNKKAVRQIYVIEAAAKKGNPNAKRAMKRLATARAVEAAIATGAVATAAVVASGKKDKKSRADKVRSVKSARQKLASGTASREELAAASRDAASLGAKDEAASLAAAAARAPSATERLQKTSAVVQAKDAGSPEARAAIDETLEKAKGGDPAAIKRAGDVVAARTLRDIQAGKPVSPAMRDAVALEERVAAGDPTAIEQARRVTEAATSASPGAEATAAAVTLEAAAVTAKALAAKPRAREEYLDRVNAITPAEKAEGNEKLAAYLQKANDGTITPAEGAEAVRLAERLGKAKVAAEISAKAPPLDLDDPRSSLPDVPLAPISGPLSLVKEALRALTLSTRDPLGNYREGVIARSRVAEAPASSAGWSPFDYFKRMIPGATLATSAATLVSSLRKKPAPSPAPAPAAPAPAQAEKTPEKAEKPEKSPESQAAGEDKTLRDYVMAALMAKKMSRRDFEAAVASHSQKTGRGKAEVTSVLRDLLVEHGVAIMGADRSFREYVEAAINTKKMSRRDFNSAVEAHAGPGATPAKKTAIAEAVLKFMAGKGITIEK